MAPDVANAAREAFVHAMSGASVVVAIVAALGAVIAWRYLPARVASEQSNVQPAPDPMLAEVSS
jgi:hypothetical protein